MDNPYNLKAECFKLRWGIMGTGRIAEKFAQDLLINPISRGTSDVVHVLIGVGSSSSTSKAQEFLDKFDAPGTCEVFGSYEGLVLSSNVEAVYIATPHSCHFENAMLALCAGKHVLCEKPLTVNTEQTKILMKMAAQKNLFLMEGMWTRFQPIGLEVRRLIERREVGDITRAFADNSLGMDPALDFAPEDRMVSKDLAGGALLDLGPYPLQWITAALAKDLSRPLEVRSLVSKCSGADVDESDNILLKFAPHNENTTELLGVASVSLRAADDYDGRTPVVRYQGNQGEIQIFGRPWRPSHLRVFKRKQGFGSTGSQVHEFENSIPHDVYGLAYEADEVARCIRDGKLQSTIMSWDESLIIMEIIDRVRRDNGLQFSDDIESLEYHRES